MAMLIQEFLASGDAGEAERSLHELDAPSYHHEFVRCCVDAAFEHPEKAASVCKLLAHMSNSGEQPWLRVHGARSCIGTTISMSKTCMTDACMHAQAFTTDLLRCTRDDVHVCKVQTPFNS